MDASGKIDPMDILNDFGLFTCKTKHAESEVYLAPLFAQLCSGTVKPLSKQKDSSINCLLSSGLLQNFWGEIEQNYSASFDCESAKQISLPASGHSGTQDAMEVLSDFGFFTQKVKQGSECFCNFAVCASGLFGEVEVNYRSEATTEYFASDARDAFTLASEGGWAG